jgi:hypothetical protein
VTHLQALGFE